MRINKVQKTIIFNKDEYEKLENLISKNNIRSFNECVVTLVKVGYLEAIKNNPTLKI